MSAPSRNPSMTTVLTAHPWSYYSKSRPSTDGTRPRTGQSRPTTAVTTKHETSYVISVFEGRGVAREVGMAALDKDTGKVMINQLADCQTYVKTLHQMHVHNPCLILFPDTFFSAADNLASTSGKRQSSTSLLVKYIQEEFSGVPIEPVARKYWSDSAGLEFILQLCVENDERPATIVAASNKYYALSAICALFKHAEIKLNTRYAAGSLLIRCVPVEGTMMIDPDTARNLELVCNMAHKKSSHSLFGMINHTYTPMASRLLRVNILSPITVQNSIDARLDVVEELIQSEDKFSNVRDALKTVNKVDFDKLISSLATSEARDSNTAKAASARVSQMLSLRSVIRNLPQLHKAIIGSRSQLLQIIHEMISDDRLTRMESLICNNINEESTLSKVGIGAVNARVYAVKANCNRLLDVARETYKENVGDIFQLNRKLSEQHELPLALVYQDSGFVFALKKNEFDGELPKGFINATTQRGRWLFTSMELKKMNARMKDALDETLILSDRIIQDLVAEILADIGALYMASEAVALLDMLWSFAHTSIMRNYVRPEFTGTLAIKAGRHPILEGVQSAGTLIPNDVYCDDASSFQIIQGPNMSGKSTYLRQIGLMVVMAMTGCYVPAEYASFRIHDSLLTRLSNDDDMEKSLSTFSNEMASTAMIIGLASSKSLILIDELGRGTSPRDGVGISHAIAESLIELRPFVFFATHFSKLAMTLSRQPSVINLHLSVQKSKSSASNFGMTFQYKIVDGAPGVLDYYGLEIAKFADLPDDVLTEGRTVATRLSSLDALYQTESRSNKIATRRKALLTLRNQLTQALNHSALPEDELLAYIGRFQTEIARVFRN